MTQDGGARIDWTARQMPMLAALRSRFEATRPLQGRRIGVCLHVEPKTAVMCETLRAGGADLAVTGSPGTTQDDVAEALGKRGCTVFTRSTDGASEHQANIAAVIDWGPEMLLDNGADLLFRASQSGTLHQLIGGTEETTTGANRLREDLAEPPPFPVIVINDSPLKLIVENKHGVGQSVVQAFMQRTNLMLPGRACVVIGYGWCGRGIARTLRSLGARVSVVETDAIRALEAGMDGMSVKTLNEALRLGEAFFTVTGRPRILGRREFERMRDGAVLANAGHFSWEIDLDALRGSAVESTRPAAGIEELRMRDGRRLALLAGGEMLNVAGAGGNPIGTMDLGLSLQAQCLELLAQRPDLPIGPQPVPDSINRAVASAMLAAMQGRDADTRRADN